MKLPSSIALSGVIIAAGIAYLPLLASLVSVSRAKYAGHVVFVPFVAAALLWLERDRIRDATSPDRSSQRWSRRLGIVVAALAVALMVSGHHTASVALQALSLIAGLAAGLVWRYGMHAVRPAAFALAFLLLTIPPPRGVTTLIASILQHFVAALAGIVLSVLQIPVVQQGLFLQLPSMTLEVTEGCAGIRFLLILFVLGTAFARVAAPTASGQLLLMVLSVPIAIVANTIRVITIAAGTHLVGHHVATGPLHYYIGKACWVLAFMALFAAAVALRSSGDGGRARGGHGADRWVQQT